MEELEATRRYARAAEATAADLQAAREAGRRRRRLRA